MITKRKFQQTVIFCLVLFLANIITHDAFSQQQLTVSGRVIDTNRETLPGVTVVVKGTTTGTVTDLNGRYSINVPSENTVLTFSFIGFKTYEIAVGNSRVIDIRLEEDLLQLGEVIVTGFGNLNRATYTGSASVIKTADLASVPNQSVATMIQSNAPGVSITSSNSQPGGVSTMRIRGYGSFSASNSPLIVIDGVPVMSGDINQTGRSGVHGGTDIMSTLNPNDIANITVIKDAAAASLWGSRAANGVILITTRQGNRNSMQVSFSSEFGQSDFAYRYRPIMGGEERRQFIYDAYVRQATYGLGLSGTAAEQAKADPIAYADAMMAADAARELPRWSVEPWSGWTDWEKETFRKGSHNNQELSVSGGTDRMTYYSSFSHSNSKGREKNQELNRFTGRMNISYDAKSWFKLGGNLMLSDMKQDLGRSDNWYTAPMYAVYVKNTPSDPVFNPDGTFNTVLVGVSSMNPIPVYKYDSNEQRVTRAFNTLFMEFKPLSALTFKTTLSYDITNSRGDRFEHPINTYGSDALLNGVTRKSYYEYRQMVWSSNVNYIKTFANRHNFNALVAYEIMDYYNNFLSGQQSGFLNYDYIEISNGSVPSSIGGFYEQDRLVSYISKADYNYLHKYYVGGSFRRDGTSRLHADSRWGNFWSVSGGWRFTDENFMKGVSNFISNGKLRISYGANGTRPSGRYSYLSLASTTNSYNGATALMESNIANNKLLWESNYTLNTGIDVTINNRFDVTFEFYNRTTKNLLMPLPISTTTGFSTYTTNIGSIRNRGVEFTINSQNIRNNDFSWNTQFNISHNKNEILKLDGTDSDVVTTATGSTPLIQRVGLPYYQYSVVEFSHIDPETGRPMFFMNNLLDDGTRNREVTGRGAEATRIPYKSPFPKVTMGLSNHLRWKFIDLSFTFSSTLGGYSYDRAADKTETSGASDALINQVHTFYHNSWKQPGDNAKFEAWIPGNSSAFGMGSIHNSRRIHSTDHIRLKNFTVGVNMPRNWTNEIRIQQARLFFTGHNLWTIAAYDQYDPEVPSDGVVWYNTPPMKSWSVGINVNF